MVLSGSHTKSFEKIAKGLDVAGAEKKSPNILWNNFEGQRQYSEPMWQQNLLESVKRKNPAKTYSCNQSRLTEIRCCFS